MGQMMLHTIPQISFPPDELKPTAEAAGELRAVPLPGVLSVKEEVSKSTTSPHLRQIKSPETTRHSRNSHLHFFCLRCFPVSVIQLSLLQKAIRISIRLTEASQSLAVWVGHSIPWSRGMGLRWESRLDLGSRSKLEHSHCG